LKESLHQIVRIHHRFFPGFLFLDWLLINRAVRGILLLDRTLSISELGINIGKGDFFLYYRRGLRRS